jgi:hypothetical protein
MSVTFEPGEWAVLRHSAGGRMFEVGGVLPTSPCSENFRVWEAQSELAQRTNQPKFEVWSNHLVKVPSREAAVRLTAVFDHIHAEHKRKVAQLETEQRKAFESAIREYEVYEE